MNVREIWPNFYIVGAAKCGTTSLYAELKTHPQVFLPEVKEPNYFVSLLPTPEMRVRQEHRAGDRDGYLQLYRDAGGFPAIGDASPSYLWDENAPGRIQEVSPNARIIIILRDPIERAYSQFLMGRLIGTEPPSMTFRGALERDRQRQPKGWWAARLYVELGQYHGQILRYFKTFGRESVLVLSFEELKKSPGKVYSEIARHIGIDPSPFLAETFAPQVHNAFHTPRFYSAYHFLTKKFSRELRRKILPAALREWLHSSPLFYSSKKMPLDDEAKLYLQSIYEPEIANLEDLLGRELPDLRKSWAPVPTLADATL